MKLKEIQNKKIVKNINMRESYITEDDEAYIFTVDLSQKLLLGQVGELVDALREGLQSSAEPLVVGLDGGEVAREHGLAVSGLGAGPDNPIQFNNKTIINF
jgi:hypothetical protein